MHFVIGAKILGTYGIINSKNKTYSVLVFMRANINGDVCEY